MTQTSDSAQSPFKKLHDYIKGALATFAVDPPTSKYLIGYKHALEDVHTEAERLKTEAQKNVSDTNQLALGL